MDTDDPFVIWLIGGLLLMALEFVVPGGIVFFLGLGASLVAVLLYLGVIDGWLPAFTAWFVGSLALLFGLRGVVQRFVPATRERVNTDEDLDAYDHDAEVTRRIPGSGEGRIAFRGSDWAARSYHDDCDLEAGTRVRILRRDNLTWVVEPLDEGRNNH